MPKWLSRAGFILIAIAVLSWFSQFLPVDVWHYIDELFGQVDETRYYKVKVADGSNINIGLLIALGVLLVLSGKYFQK